MLFLTDFPALQPEVDYILTFNKNWNSAKNNLRLGKSFSVGGMTQFYLQSVIIGIDLYNGPYRGVFLVFLLKL